MTDSELIKDFLGGNPVAYTQLVERYETKVFRMVMGLIGDYHDSQEIAQDIFVKLYFKLAGFKGTAAFSTWLYTVVQNTVKNYRMKKQLKQWVSLDWLFETIHFDVPSEALPAENKVETQETITLLNRALDQVPFHFRQILILREVNELSYEEIATVLNCSLGTVKSRLSRAKEKLSELFKTLEKGDAYVTHGNLAAGLPKPQNATAI